LSPKILSFPRRTVHKNGRFFRILLWKLQYVGIGIVLNLGPGGRSREQKKKCLISKYLGSQLNFLWFSSFFVK
jgi:hypothetical protein